MIGLDKILLDLNAFKILLFFQNRKEPLALHFDRPSRRFYFSLIALITIEMKNKNAIGFVHVRKHEQLIRWLDKLLAAQYASRTVDRMWEKIRTTWHYTLPDLETAANFKILDKDLLPPYEKGGKYRYNCSEEESDIWANLFATDESNPWKLKFAVDSASLRLDDIHLTLDNLTDGDAWKEFIARLSKTQKPGPGKIDNRGKSRQAIFSITVIAVFVSVIIACWSVWHFTIRPVSDEVKSDPSLHASIVVLPFTNISGDPDKEYLCDGITEDLINNLAKIKDLHVISRTSAFYFKNKNLDLRTIVKKLNVDNVLEGSVRISGDNLKITAQLLKTDDDSHLWAETYNRNMKNIIDFQEDLAQEIVCNLKSHLGCNKGHPLAKDYTKNLEAYNLYLKGRALWKNRWSKQSLVQAVEYFEQAITIDPTYALAYAGQADLYNEIGFYFGESVPDFHLKAKAAALKALEIDNMLAEAHAALGFNKLVFEWDWKGAEASCKKAIDLNPGSAVAHKNYSMTLRGTGRLDEAIREMKASLALDPISLEKLMQYVVTLRMAVRPGEAIQQAKKALELYPNHPNAITFLGSLYAEIGNFEQGIDLLTRAVKLTNRQSPFALGFLGLAYALSGDRENANAIINELIGQFNQGKYYTTMISLIYNGLNDKDKTFEWLEKAYVIHDPRLFTIKTISQYKKLHSDRRWSDLMKKMGLSE